MPRHKNLNSREVSKKEICISDNFLLKLISFSKKLYPFFLNSSCNAVFKAWCFKNFFLKHGRHFIVDFTICIFFWIRTTSCEIKSCHEKNRNLRWNISFRGCFWKYEKSKNYENLALKSYFPEVKVISKELTRNMEIITLGSNLPIILD